MSVKPSPTSSPTSKLTQLLYAAGQGGNVVGDTLIQTFLLRFYLPPGGESLFPTLIWGFLPAWVSVNLLARMVDAIADPVVAARSDASRHRFGRRRVFMMYGVLPLALTSALLFFPPQSEQSTQNFWFLLVVFSSYFVAFTVYVAPYLAMLPDIAKSAKERTDLSTLQAVFALAGASLPGMLGPMLFFSKEGVFREEMPALAVTMAFLSFLLMMLPILGVREIPLPENKTLSAESNETLFAQLKDALDELKETVRDVHFKWYLVGTVSFFFAFNIIRAAAPYYVEVLMRRPLQELGGLMAVTFGVAFLAFFLVNPLTKRIGHRQVMVGASVLLAITLCGTLVVESPTQGYVLMGICGLPIAALLSVPNAMLADICAAHTERKGVKREAMFFGAQGFFMKANLGLSSAALGVLLSALGNSIESPMGVRLSGPMAALVLLVASAAFLRYETPQLSTSQEEQL